MADGHDNPNALWRGSQLFFPIALPAMPHPGTLRADLERQERAYRPGCENR